MSDKNIDITNYQRNIQFLTTELFKIMNDLVLLTMKMLCLLLAYNFDLRNYQEFAKEKENWQLWLGNYKLSYSPISGACVRNYLHW